MNEYKRAADRFARQTERKCFLCKSKNCEHVGIYVPHKTMATKLDSKLLPYWLCKKCCKKEDNIQLVEDKFLLITSDKRN